MMIARMQPVPERWAACGLPSQQPAWRVDSSEVPSLPLDLSTWVDKCTLLVRIEDEVLRLDWNNPLVVEHLRSHPEYRPKTMLSLLCLAYSTQVFNSQEIQSRCHSHPEFALMCDGQVPFAHELTRFRRQNRTLITEVLARVFTKICHSRCDVVVAGDAWEKEIRDIASARLDIARHMDTCD